MKSLKFKIVFLAASVFSIFMGILFYFFYDSFKQRQVENFDLYLYNYAVDLANSIDITLLGQIVVTPQGQEIPKLLPPSFGTTNIQIRNVQGQVLVSSPPELSPMPLQEGSIRAVLTRQSLFSTFSVNQKVFRSVLIPIRREPFEPLILQVASGTTGLIQERQVVLKASLFLLGISIMTVAGVSYWTIHRSLASVYSIIQAARMLEPSSFPSRLPEPEETELRELSASLNEFLERVDRALASQERFSADASHQLKTPLALMKAQLDLAYSQKRSPEEMSEMIRGFSSDLQRLSGIVDNLLLMARFDSGAQDLKKDMVRLDEIVLEVISQLQFMARERKIQMECEISEKTEGEDLEIRGDENLLKILFYNLIENALKHSFPETKVRVLLGSAPEKICVEVQDQGPGIPPAEQAKIFERFYRGGDRQNEISGAGLGLSIAKRIADLHRASISLQSDLSGGAGFIVEMKKT